MPRGLIEGLETPHPIGQQLPGVFADDDFAQQFVSGLDAVLAPVFNVLDCLEAYFDPHVAPEDFVDWLASWVGVELDDSWPAERSRTLLSEIVGLYGRRGTVTGLRELLRIYTGHEPHITDSGGATWSPVPGGDLPGEPVPRLRVRVPAGEVGPRRVRELVASTTPAHVVAEVEVTG